MVSVCVSNGSSENITLVETQSQKLIYKQKYCYMNPQRNANVRIKWYNSFLIYTKCPLEIFCSALVEFSILIINHLIKIDFTFIFPETGSITLTLKHQAALIVVRGKSSTTSCEVLNTISWSPKNIRTKLYYTLTLKSFNFNINL